MRGDESEVGGCCTGGHDRREFMAGMGLAVGAAAMRQLDPGAVVGGSRRRREKEGAVVRVAFLYPPSKTFADDPGG